MQIALENPGLISLAAGFVDFETLPIEAIRQASLAVLADEKQAQSVLQYGTTRGHAGLRQAVIDLLAELDGLSPDAFPAGAGDVIITTGSQQSLHMVADLLLDPGDIVIAGWPSYFVFTGALDTFGAQVRAVDLDQDGMRPEALEAMLESLKQSGELSRVKMVYIVTEYQNPTGLTLSEARRAQVLEIVKKYSTDHRILLVEDAAYRELGPPPPEVPPSVPAGSTPSPEEAQLAPQETLGESALGKRANLSIKSLDTSGEFVAYMGTFSKSFSPGLKTGYSVLPRDLVEAAVLNKGGRDFGTPNFNQALIAEAMQTGDYAQHVKTLQAAYASKRAACLQALDQHMTDIPGAAWTNPSGGLYVWLTLPESIDTGKGGGLFEEAVEAGVLYVPGAYCYPNDTTRTAPTNTIRLSFGVAGIEAIGEGIKRLSEAVRAVLA